MENRYNQSTNLVLSEPAQRLEELNTLLEIAGDLASTLELEPLLGLILQRLRKVVDYSGAAIFSASIESNQVEILAYQGPLDQAEVLKLNFSAERAVCYQTVIQQATPVIIPDIWGDHPLAKAMRSSAGSRLSIIFQHAHSWLGIPLLVRKRLVGFLRLDHSEAYYYSEHHAAIALAFANHAAIALENSRLYREVREKAALVERQRLARDLHDSVSQALYGIGLNAQAAITLCEKVGTSAAFGDILGDILMLAQTGQAELRSLIFALQPEVLEAQGLLAAISRQLEAIEKRYCLRVVSQLPEQEPELTLVQKEALYRILQEATHNVVKHACAAKLTVKLEIAANQVRLEIADDGQGFNPDEEYPGHLGLQSMRERISGLGGELNIESHHGQGSQLRAYFPLNKISKDIPGQADNL
jgi:signal transduction histidine kinase